MRRAKRKAPSTENTVATAVGLEVAVEGRAVEGVIEEAEEVVEDRLEVDVLLEEDADREVDEVDRDDVLDVEWEVEDEELVDEVPARTSSI
ncbi:hypothetical protein CALVIDRAFT_559739 [Calocera viscosa TUFC12733]|uniref:Uncharacterized protein n=1 Tax=Calocera viscosa (strain TUFC12733) TaxID=1330018 RepID=A0A167RMX2_CALVF|nr:hypothetical protein CALVIDRAFT_559739 [Calocera viscosa TUFC12733]